MATKIIDREAPAVVVSHRAAAPVRASRLSSRSRMLMLIILSSAIRSAALSAASEFMNNELGSVSRTQRELPEVFAVVAYKGFTAWLAWTLQLDFVDISAVTALANMPFFYLLLTYYQISTTTIAITYAIEIVSVAFPTYLLQRRSAVHNPRASLRHRYLIESFQVQQSANLLAVAVYVVAIWIAQKTGKLNYWLVSHFDIPTVEAAYQETVVSIVIKVFSAGVAAKAFLLNPSIAAEAASGTATPVEAFDPATADLQQTLKHNIWVRSKRTRTLLWQTAVLCLFVFGSTVQRVLTLEGTDFTGAAGYAGLWVVATVLNSAWWAWIGTGDT